MILEHHDHYFSLQGCSSNTGRKLFVLCPFKDTSEAEAQLVNPEQNLLNCIHFGEQKK